MSLDIMARLVSVYRSDEYQFQRRQIPLEIEDSPTMVIQFNDTCVGCDQVGIKQKELERFVQKYHALSNDEVAVALMVTSKDVINLLSQMVPCVGCRRSVERLFRQLVVSGYPALEPLIITPSSSLSIKREYLFDPKAIYALFYIHGSKLNVMMDSMPKSKKNKRCVLHSLDSHTNKNKSLGSWMDIWELLSTECREEVVQIECDRLMDTLETYLRKHRFCSECKSKVLRAYSILVGDLDPSTEKEFCPALYDGLKCCQKDRHLHIPHETTFIATLIERAEPELTGSSRRERHAKTLNVAQEEVLTCLAIHLYERLHKIWQKLRAEEQTWQILFYLGVDALRKSFEIALEKKQGMSNLELVYQEILEEEQAQAIKREQKRQKRKKRKNKGKTEADLENPTDMEKDKENCTQDCQCDENVNVTSAKCASCDDHDSGIVTMDNCACDTDSEKKCIGSSATSNRSDPGYSSGHDGCESCSSHSSSHSGSDIPYTEHSCNLEGESPIHNPIDFQSHCKECDLSPGSSKSQSPIHKGRMSKCDGSNAVSSSATRFGTALSLQDMLEAHCSSGEEEDGISEEEIRNFKANQKLMNTRRQELRKTLRQRFANMQQRSCVHRCEAAQGPSGKHPT